MILLIWNQLSSSLYRSVRKIQHCNHRQFPLSLMTWRKIAFFGNHLGESSTLQGILYYGLHVIVNDNFIVFGGVIVLLLGCAVTSQEKFLFIWPSHWTLVDRSRSQNFRQKAKQLFLVTIWASEVQMPVGLNYYCGLWESVLSALFSVYVTQPLSLCLSSVNLKDFVVIYVSTVWFFLLIWEAFRRHVTIIPGVSLTP